MLDGPAPWIEVPLTLPCTLGIEPVGFSIRAEVERARLGALGALQTRRERTRPAPGCGQPPLRVALVYSRGSVTADEVGIGGGSRRSRANEGRSELERVGRRPFCMCEEEDVRLNESVLCGRADGGLFAPEGVTSGADTGRDEGLQLILRETPSQLIVKRADVSAFLGAYKRSSNGGARTGWSDTKRVSRTRKR